MTASIETLIDNEIAYAKTFRGHAFRNVAHKYAKRGEIHSIAGSLSTGARYNYIGEFGALYLSTSWTTCFLETLKDAGSDEEIAQLLPRTVIGFEVDCDRILDLTDPGTLKRLDVKRDDLLADWLDLQDKGVESLTQNIGRIAREKGFHGILAPSAADPAGSNLVLFPDQMSATGSYAVINEDRLG